MGSFTYYVITEGGEPGGGSEMITLNVIVTCAHTVKVITDGREGVQIGQKLIT